MANAEYNEQLKDKRWYYVRDRVLERDRWKCRSCRSIKNLQVHHLRYEFGRKAWEYNDSDLVTLCDSCHRQVHEGDGTIHLDPLQEKLNALVTVCTGWIPFMKSKYDG